MNLRVVLISPRNPLNIGAAARAMSNFGVAELRLVNPYNVAFLEAKSAVKSRDVLLKAREFPTVADAVADCALIVGTTSIGHRALEHPLRRLETGGRIIAKRLASAPVALLFGSEKFGLSNEDMSYCHWLMRIPTREEHGSMNLGQSVAVCLYEIIRKQETVRATPEAKRPASAEGSTKMKIRRLVRRMDLNAHDAEVWLGMLRQIKWKLLN
jgi:TrmH family RNA methyltransferase